MATPNRAPRRSAAQMSISVASGVPAPGANSYQEMRKSCSPGDGATARQAVRQNTGLTPGNVAVNVDKSPQA